ncbi:hypothetical protein RFN25_04770, partial [Mesorhizobium abyssinicae]|nr:hypothetical protein [Mesorhizobium abyssinicae]
ADAYRPAANQQGDLTGARHTMPAAAPHQAAVVQRTRRRKRGREHPDEALFAAYRAEVAKTAKVSESSITGDIVALRKFSKWLDENHRTQIAGRIEDPGLDALAKNFVGNNVVLLGDTKVALEHKDIAIIAVLLLGDTGGLQVGSQPSCELCRGLVVEPPGGVLTARGCWSGDWGKGGSQAGCTSTT